MVQRDVGVCKDFIAMRQDIYNIYFLEDLAGPWTNAGAFTPEKARNFLFIFVTDDPMSAFSAIFIRISFTT